MKARKQVKHIRRGPRARRGGEVLQGVEGVYVRLIAGEPLDQFDRAAISKILWQTLHGFDARLELGVKPQRGAPPRNQAEHSALAGEYWAYRETEPVEKPVALKVAVRWNKSAGRVRAIAHANHKSVLALSKRIGWDGILFFADAFLYAGKAPRAKGITAKHHI